MAELFNPNELIFDQVVDLGLTSLVDDKIIARLTQLEESNLEVTSEADETVDALGSPITTLYRSKKALFTASNSLFSLDLFARQMGSEKEIASTGSTKRVPIVEIVEAKANKLTLSQTPSGEIKYIYRLNNRNLSETYTLTASTPASEGQFSITGKEITLPAGTEGKFYVKYAYDSETAVRVSVGADNFPEATGLFMRCIFRDPCNENIKYGGIIQAKKALIDPTSIQVALQRGGKHALSINLTKDYCDENAELLEFYVIKD